MYILLVPHQTLAIPIPIPIPFQLPSLLISIQSPRIIILVHVVLVVDVTTRATTEE